MRVIGFVENRYFRLQALKGFMVLPGYVFSFLNPVKPAIRNLQYMSNFKQNGEKGEENDLKGFRFFYPGGVSQHWKLYLQLLEKGILKWIEQDKKNLLRV
jgi:hypothetical protein